MKLTNSITATLIVMSILFIPMLSALPRDAELSIDFKYEQPSIISGANYSINTNYSDDAGLLQGLTPQQVANLINTTGLILNWSDIISGGGSQTPWTSDIYAEGYDLYSRGDLMGIDRLVVKVGSNTFAQGFYYQGEFNSKPYFFNGDASFYIFYDGTDSQWTISNSAPANGTSASITVGKSATMLGTYTYSDADTSIVQPNYGIFDDKSSVFIDGLITPVIKNYAGLDIFETENQIIRMADNTVAIRFSGVPDASDIMTLATDGSTGIRRFEFNNGIASGGIISVGTNDRKLYGTSGSIDPAIDWTNGYQIKFPAYTSNGLLKTTSGDGRIEVDTNTYLTDFSTLTGTDVTTALGFTPIQGSDVPPNEQDGTFTAWYNSGSPSLTDLSLSGYNYFGDTNQKIYGTASTSLTLDATRLNFFIGGTQQVHITDGYFKPDTDADVILGDTSYRFKTGYFWDGTTGATLTDGTNAGYFTYGAKTATLGSSTNAGSFTDGTNTADLSDGTYGVNANTINAGTGFYVGGSAGLTQTIPLAPDTTIGQTTAGSMTFTGGILTAYTAAS